jgi:RNA polymerase sigma-70 factor (ECF subfamily)
MGGPSSTRPSLLIRVRDSADADAWHEFVALYGPLVYRFARKQGLQDADAADLAQTVLHGMIEGIRRLEYDPRKGSFRSWLYRVVRNHLSKFHAVRKRSLTVSGGSEAHRLLEDIAAGDAETTELWDREFERQVFLWASERVRGRFEASSWQAFWQTAVEGRDASEIAESLGMTVGSIYTAKSRILDRIRKEIREAQGDEPFFPKRDRDEIGELS